MSTDCRICSTFAPQRVEKKGEMPALRSLGWNCRCPPKTERHFFTAQLRGWPQPIHFSWQKSKDPDAVRSKTKKSTNLSRHRTPLLMPIGSRSHIFRLEGVGKELQSIRKERKDPPQRKTRQQVDEDSKKQKKKKKQH